MCVMRSGVQYGSAVQSHGWFGWQMMVSSMIAKQKHIYVGTES